MSLTEPSNSKELEKKVLNTMLHDTDECNYVLKRVEQNDFYFTNHKAIFSVIKDMRQRDYAITLDTVYNYLITKKSSAKADLAWDTIVSFMATETGIPFGTKDTDIKLLREMSFQRKVKLLENPTIDDLNVLAEMRKDEVTAELVNPEALLESLNEESSEKIYSTKIKNLDGNYKFIKGQMTIISGIPSHGKSEFCDQIITNTIKHYDFKWLVFSPENYPVKSYLKRKLIPKIMGYRPTDTNVIRETAEFLLNHIDIISPDTEKRTLEDILSLLSEKYDAFLIDPWNELYHDFEKKGMSETRYIEHSLTRIRNEVRARNIHAFVAVHPRKMEKVSIDQRNKMLMYYAQPKAYDIMGSANWYAKADSIISLYKPPEVNGQTVEPAKNSQVHILKVREARLGEPGVVPLTYDKQNGVIA